VTLLIQIRDNITLDTRLGFQHTLILCPYKSAVLFVIASFVPKIWRMFDEILTIYDKLSSCKSSHKRARRPNNFQFFSADTHQGVK